MPLALPYSQGFQKSGRNALVPSNDDFVPTEVGSGIFKLGRWNLKTNNKKVIFLFFFFKVIFIMAISKHEKVNNDTPKNLSSNFNNYQFFANRSKSFEANPRQILLFQSENRSLST